ncbi:hypothetical protein F4553_000421 [Allocatelliglobosispora scoriae]|uniref:Uncharacterized protein n=1 Tax=Allocatelliglobosispora scoriae TaxID=643052 RepID=A0A841BJU0_9ACTN|nr:hypothetical protein [Allocatelliglobosispora scoriae]MBB5867042.1 hypothetical protein [Allocatelliglobosispora scoriae]
MADSASSGALVIGVLGGVLGTIVWLRWRGTKAAYGGWKTARAGIPKAKAGRGKARTAFGLAVRGLVIALVIFVVYVIATSTAMFKG